MSSFKTLSQAFSKQDTGSVPTNPPTTQTASAHSVTIRTNNGLVIGRIQRWDLDLARIVDTEFELGLRASGEPIERVSQVQNVNQIAVERYEMYTKFLGEAFNAPLVKSPIMYSLAQQAAGFQVRETFIDPFGAVRGYLYMGVRFSNMGVTISATDDRIVKARATLQFARRVILA